jgi:glutathione S-transferase
MADELVLYYNPQSRARIAHYMLEEVGVPYRIEFVRFDKGEQKLPAYLAVNPMGKLPALAHRGVVVTEAAAICAYLADAFPAAGLAPPAASPERGTYYRWLFFAAGCIDPAIVDRMLERPPATRPGALGYGCYEDVLGTLEKAIAPGPYVLGERFSAVDVLIASQIGFGLLTKGLEPRASFQAYQARISARPAWKRFNQQAEQYVALLRANG